MDGLLVLTNQHQDAMMTKTILLIKDSWALIIEEISLDSDDKLGELKHDALTLPCLQSDGFCKATLKHPYLISCFSDEIGLIFHISDFIGLMSQLNNRYWLETDDFFNNTGKNI